MQQIDNNITLWIQEHMVQYWLNPFMVFISKLGDMGLIWIALGILFLFFGIRNKKRLQQGLTLLLCLASNALVCNVLLKPLVARTRPYDLLQFDILVPKLSDYSFPSGHTSASFAAATAIYAYSHKWGIVAYIFATLMGISRLYLGVHFFTDVLSGAILGTFMAKITLWAISKRKQIT